MRLATLTDKTRLEEICNDPSIRLWTSFEGAPLCDGLKYLTKPSFSVIGEEGCFLASYLDPTRYIIHTNILPDFRGERAVKASQEALAIAFLQTDATELLTMVPSTIPHAKLHARRMGFRSLFVRKNLWPCNGHRYDVEFYSLSVGDWVADGGCSASGAWFHDQLGETNHADDPIHDAFVGAAVEMVKAGNVVKALGTYNEWARLAMYEPVHVISTSPLRIDIKQCVLRIEGDQFFMEAPNA